MQAYNQMIPGFSQTAMGYMQNPFSNPFFQTQQQLGTRQAQQLGGTQMSSLLHNMLAGGMAGGASSPAGLEMLQNQARANTGLQANLGFLSPVQNALQQQQYYSGLASGFRPLQTGQTQTEKTGGLGSWLPQVAGMALGAAGGLFGGGAGGGGGTPGAASYNMSDPSFYAGAFNSPTSFMPTGAGSASGGFWGGVPGNFGAPSMGGGMGGYMLPGQGFSAPPAPQG